MARRLFPVLALVGIAVLLVAAPAAAKNDDSRHDDRRINITGALVVADGETVDTAVSVDGDVLVDGVVDDLFVGKGNVTINGRVKGDVFVASGDASVNGHVTGDVVVLNGRAIVRDGASVRGDVTSGKQPRVARGTVRGNVEKMDLGTVFGGVVIVLLAFLWIGVTVSVAILGLVFVLVFPRAADSAVAAARGAWPAIGWGLLFGVVGPVVAVAALVSIVGIPLGLGMLGALAILTPLGYVVSCLLLGRAMVKRQTTGGRVGAFFAGFGILRVIALIPGVGLVVWFLASVYGLGALVVAAWRAARRGEPAPPASEPAPLAPEPPATTSKPEPPVTTSVSSPSAEAEEPVAWSSPPPGDAGGEPGRG